MAFLGIHMFSMFDVSVRHLSVPHVLFFLMLVPLPRMISRLSRSENSAVLQADVMEVGCQHREFFFGYTQQDKILYRAPVYSSVQHEMFLRSISNVYPGSHN